MKSALVAPPGLMFVGGKLVRRTQGLVEPEAPLVCYDGHEVERRTDNVDGLAGHPCRWKSNTMHGRCGFVVLELRGSSVRSFRADLTADEWDEMKRRGWRAAEILRYIGAEMPDARSA